MGRRPALVERLASNQLEQEGGRNVQERNEIIEDFANYRLSVTEGSLEGVRELEGEKDLIRAENVQRYIEIRI